MNFSILIVIFIAFAPSAFANYFETAQQCVRQGGCTRPIVIPKKPKLPPIKTAYGIEEARWAESIGLYAGTEYTMEAQQHAKKLGPNDKPGIPSGPEGSSGISARKHTGPHLLADQNIVTVREMSFDQTTESTEDLGTGLQSMQARPRKLGPNDKPPLPMGPEGSGGIVARKRTPHLLAEVSFQQLKPRLKRMLTTREVRTSVDQNKTLSGRLTLQRIIRRRPAVSQIAESDRIEDQVVAQQSLGGNGKTSGGCIVREMNKHLSSHLKRFR